MRRFIQASLAIFLFAVGPAATQDITVYRCQDASGRAMLQDEPCAAGQTQTMRQMTRPQDPVPKPAASPEPEPQALPPEPPPPGPALPYPPPPLFQCTDYDGEVRFSEDYDPNTRCVPLSVLGYDVRGSAQGAASCRWVSESCLRLDDASACDQFKARLKTARSNALHAFSDTAAFRKSEAIRIERIVNESCR
ncbi:MAG: DUF4124 domain-containing protein [Arenimonas sp.]|uniref:DUF4124 domain-containing protein n=1 Tax=Arenimonas sp. TaxID=1872635 RepID=UPI0025BA5F02|nr:DUF4124 domain-containing protein [Arenimonas sp.]MBW8367793.1 DUF4124 domain-containing protein [Arenimonas sp.]